MPWSAASSVRKAPPRFLSSSFEATTKPVPEHVGNQSRTTGRVVHHLTSSPLICIFSTHVSSRCPSPAPPTSGGVSPCRRTLTIGSCCRFNDAIVPPEHRPFDPHSPPRRLCPGFLTRARPSTTLQRRPTTSRPGFNVPRASAKDAVALVTHSTCVPAPAEMPATHVEGALTNGHDEPSHSGVSAGKKAPSAKARKTGSKTSDEASRLLQARISQLEQDVAGEKDHEMEIGESCYAPCSVRRLWDPASNMFN